MSTTTRSPVTVIRPARPLARLARRLLAALTDGPPLLGPVCFWAPYPPPSGGEER
jgi:hypothetical protein